MFEGSIRLPANINVEIAGNRAMPMFKAGTILPAAWVQIFKPLSEYQTKITVHVSYGDMSQNELNMSLIKFDLAPGHLITRMHIDRYMRLRVCAKVNKKPIHVPLYDSPVSSLAEKTWWRFFFNPKDYAAYYTTDLSLRRPPTKIVDLDVLHNVEVMAFQHGHKIHFEVPSYTLCSHCAGQGAVRFIAQCPICEGSGQLIAGEPNLIDQLYSYAPFLNSHRNLCYHCKGHGHLTEKACATCAGQAYIKTFRTVTVKMPSDLREGLKVRLEGLGKPGYAGLKGDLYLAVSLKA